MTGELCESFWQLNVDFYNFLSCNRLKNFKIFHFFQLANFVLFLWPTDYTRRVFSYGCWTNFTDFFLSADPLILLFFPVNSWWISKFSPKIYWRNSQVFFPVTVWWFFLFFFQRISWSFSHDRLTNFMTLSCNQQTKFMIYFSWQ